MQRSIQLLQFGLLELLLLLVLPSLFPCTIPTKTTSINNLAKADMAITLLHSQDNYGSVVPVDSSNNPCKPLNVTPWYQPVKGTQCYGGLDRRAGVAAQVRAEVGDANVVLIDAGNSLMGSIFYLTFGSEVISTYYSAMAYDAVKVEVHDFVTRIETIANYTKRLGQSSIPVVSANVYNMNNDSRFVALAGGYEVVPYALIDVAGGGGNQNKVGFIGTLAVNLGQLFGEPRLVNSYAELTALRNTVARLQNMGVNKIVVSVSGPTVVEDIIEQVPGIDVLIVISQLYGTNLTTVTSTAGPYPEVHDMPWGQPVLVVGTGANLGKFFGRLDLVFDDYGVIKSWGGEPILLDNSSPLDTALHQDILNRQALVDNQSNTIIGETLETLGYENQCMFGECTIGLWTTDAMRRVIAGVNIQIALYNGGSMYAPIPRGNITLGQVQTAMPITNSEFHTCEIEGRYLWAAMENSLLLVTNTSLNINQGIGRFLSISGMRVLYNPNEQQGMRVVEIWVESQTTPGAWDLLDFDQLYLIGMPRFIYGGGDGYTMISQNCKNTVPRGLPMLSVWLQDLAQNSPIQNLQAGRLNVTTLSRRACISDDNGTLCNGNGKCFLGACECTVEGASGDLCAVSATSAGGSSGLSSGSIAGIIVGAAVGGLCLLITVIVVTAVLASIRKRGPVEQEWIIDFEELEIGDLLGRGGYGEVYRGRWKGTEVAVKTIKADSITRDMKRHFVEETSMMSRLRHPNVVLFMAASTKPPTLCIVMEFMALGSLYDLISNDLVVELPIQLKLKLMYQAAKGMHFLHSSGIAHRDLKSLNLLLDNKWNLKVADFGLTVFRDSLRRHGEDPDGAMVGSVPWMAPELLQDIPDCDYVLCDVYAFGIILWEVLTRKKPYEGFTAPQVAIAVIRNDLRPSIPPTSQLSPCEIQYVDLMAMCWHRDPSVRPVFLDIMNELVKMGNSNTSSGNIFTSSTYGSSSSGSSAAHQPSFQYSTATRHTNSKSSASSASSRSDYASGDAAAAPERPINTKGVEAVPRRDVSFVVCDLARFDDIWRDDPVGADKAINHFGKVVKRQCGIHGGHIFSTPSFHSGGTFMLAFAKPTKAAEFALNLQRDIRLVQGLEFGKAGRETTLQDHSRVSVAFREGLCLAPAEDRIRTSYEPRDYEDALRLNTGCPAAAVVCSPSFRSCFEQSARAAGGLGSEGVAFIERKHNGTVLIVREGEESVGDDDHENARADDDDDDSDDEEGTRLHHVETSEMRRDREAGVCSSNMCPWIINTERIEMGDRIGEGNYGQVLEGLYHGRKVAIKRLFNNRLDDDGMRKMRKEAAILSSIDHPNVVKLMGLSVTDGNLLLVMELVPKGSLRALLSNPSISLKWHQRIAMLRDAAVGIAYLHSKGIVHRDIKSSNLLVDTNMSIKVGDFGFATAKQDNGTMTRCGTPCWTAPEILAPSKTKNKKAPNSGDDDDDHAAESSVLGDSEKAGEEASTFSFKITEKADVYSFAIVMWEVLTRRVPYEDGNMATVALDVLDGKRPRVPSDCPAKFAQMMQRCWHQKPHKRPAMDDVLMYLNGELQDFAPL